MTGSCLCPHGLNLGDTGAWRGWGPELCPSLSAASRTAQDEQDSTALTSVPSLAGMGGVGMGQAAWGQGTGSTRMGWAAPWL